MCDKKAQCINKCLFLILCVVLFIVITWPLHDKNFGLSASNKAVFNKYEDCWNIVTGIVLRVNHLGFLHFRFVIVDGSSAP